MTARLLLSLSTLGMAGPVAAGPEREAATSTEAVEKINAAHAKSPGTATEEDLAATITDRNLAREVADLFP